MKKYFINLLFFIIAILVIFRGLENIGLYVYGEKAQAHINYTEKVSNGLRFSNSNTYRVYYEFTLPDNSLQTGSSRMALRGGGEPSGWLDVRYFPFRPDFNMPDGSSIIVYSLFWLVPGIGLIIFNIFRMKKKKLKYARLGRIFGKTHSKGIDSDVVGPDSISSDNSQYPNGQYPNGQYPNGQYTSGSHRGSLLSSLISIIVLLAIGSGSAYFLFIKPAQPQEPKGAEVISAKYGNTRGNVSNGGIAVRDGDSIYFANFNDNQRLYSMNADGTGIKTLTDESASCINFYDGWIYYCNFNDSDRIYRIKPDGTGRSKVYKWKSQDVCISGGWFFLSNGNDHNRIYRVTVGGKNELKLNNDESSSLSVAGGWIYYANDTDFKKLYRIRTDGSRRTAVTDFAVSDVIADETGVFFNSADDGFLYRLDNDKSSIVKVSDGKFAMPNIIDGKIYYADDNRYLNVMNLDGSGSKQLDQVNSWFISTLGEKVMVVDFMGTDYNYLVDATSGSIQEIH